MHWKRRAAADLRVVLVLDGLPPAPLAAAGPGIGDGAHPAHGLRRLGAR
jgi:hypothetical protein